MLVEPSSPTAARHIANTGPAPKPPPLTPYRGGPPPPITGSSSSGGGGASGGATSPQALNMPAAAGSGAIGAGGPRHAPVPPLWDQALEQEKRLRGELRKKSFWDHDVRRLRGALQGTYEALMFSHYEFACAHEVEPNLWKAVFYKPIEEFRSRIRALEGLVKGTVPPPPAPPGAGGAGAAAVAATPQLASPEEARAQLARTTGAYLRFLDEALAFYRKTVWKLQWVHGSVGAVVDLDAALQNEIQECVPRATAPRTSEARQSVHRCLIYLGDLCRYQSMALKERPTSARPLWERAMSYYRQGARVLPASGNPFNQMAVMAYYTNDELRAVYYYFRSLAVAMPFVTARENLLLLFEKNRSRYGNIAASHAAAALQAGHDSDARAAAGHIADVSVRFVRLHGMLFDRINLHQFPEVLAAAMHDLEAVLGHPGCRAMLQKPPEADQLLFQLAIMNIFSVHNVIAGAAAATAADAGAGGGNNNNSYAAAAKRSELLCHALAAAMRFAAAVAGVTASMAGAAAAGGGVGDVDTGFGAMSTACHVMLAWMVSNPEVLSPRPPAASATEAARSGSGSAATSASAEAPAEVAAEVAARGAFLLAAARLASHLSDLTRRRAHDQDWQDPAVRHRSLPEDSELAGFGPLAPVVSVAASWPAASEAPGGAAVLAVRVARMLQALRHLDDALGPGLQRAAAAAAASATTTSGGGGGGSSHPPPHSPQPSPWQSPVSSVAVPPPGSALGQELARAVRGFRGAVAQATAAPTAATAAPPPPHQSGGPHATGGVSGQPHVVAGSGLGHGHAQGHGKAPASPGAAGGQAQQRQLQPQLQNGAHHHMQHPPQQQQGTGLRTPAADGAHPPHGQSNVPDGQQQQQHAHAGDAAPGSGGGAGTRNGGTAEAPRAAAVLLSSPQQQQQSAISPHASPPPPPLPRMLSGGAAAAAVPPPVSSSGPGAGRGAGAGGPAAGAEGAAAAGGGGQVARNGNDDVAEDEIVYQPPRPGSALPRPTSTSNGLHNLHRRSSSGGGGGGGGAFSGNGGGGSGPMHSQDGRGLLSKQPSSSSAAPASLLASRDASRDGSTFLLRSPSVLSTGDLLSSGGALAGAPPLPSAPNLNLNLGNLICSMSNAAGALGRLSSSGLTSGLTSPGSAQGGTLPPSPQHLLFQHQHGHPAPHPQLHPNHGQHQQQQLLLHQQMGWGDAYGSAGSGGGGGSSGTGMMPVPPVVVPAATAAGGTSGLPARPPSPAVGELPGAGTIGLLQNLLHGAGAGGAAAAASAPPVGGRRVSAGAGGAAAGPAFATAGGAGHPAVGTAATAASAPPAAGGTAGRPGSSGSNAARRLSSGAPAPGGVLTARPSSAAAATTTTTTIPATAAAVPGAASHPHPPQVLQLEHPTQPKRMLLPPQNLADLLPTQPLPMAAAAGVSAPFAGLPAGLQERAQFRPNLLQQLYPEQQNQTGTSGLLLLTSGASPPLQQRQAGPVGTGIGTLGPGQGQGQLVLPAGAFPHQQHVPPYGVSGGGGSAGTFAGLPVPLGAPTLPAGAVAAAAAGSGGGAAGVHGQLGWPPGAGGAAAGGPVDMSSYFATAAGNYQAAALAEATAEATAVAMADDVLQAMDEDDGGISGRSAGGGTVSGFATFGGAGGGAGSLYGTGDDYMDADRFSPAVAAAAGGGGHAGAAPVTREPSAGSEALFVTGVGGGTGIFGFRSSGSGSGMGFTVAAAAATAAAAGGVGLAAAAGAAGGGGGNQAGNTPLEVSVAAAMDAAGAGAGPGSSVVLNNLEGFGSWGVIPAALPEQLADYHQRLRRSGGPEGLAEAAVPPPSVRPAARSHGPQQWHGKQTTGPTSRPGTGGGGGSGGKANGVGANGSAGGTAGDGGGGLFGEDLSCLSYLAAQLRRPGAGGPGMAFLQGTAGDQG